MQKVMFQNGIIKGLLIPHGENESISKHLTIYDNKKHPIYHPSQYYVYSPSRVALESIQEVKENGYKMLENQKALRGNEIKSGQDAVGALLIFKNDPVKLFLEQKETKPVSFWSGTILSIEQTRKLGLKYAGPTVLQVAISLHSAVNWMIENPKKGILFPENLPFSEILKNSEKYLGTIFTDWVPYYPKSTNFSEFLQKN